MTISEENHEYFLTKDITIAAEIIARAFQTNKINTYISQNSSLEENLDGFKQRFEQLLGLGSYIAVDTNNSAAAVWIPPEVNYPPYPCQLNDRTQNLEDQIARCSKKYLKGRQYWHLTFLGKDPLKNDVKGSISKVVKPFLKKAIEQNVPAVLEAIDDRAKDIYLHYGFKIFETFEIGEGLKVYYMIYNNDSDGANIKTTNAN